MNNVPTQDTYGPVEHIDLCLPTLTELRFIDCDFVPEAIASLETSIARCACIEVCTEWVVQQARRVQVLEFSFCGLSRRPYEPGVEEGLLLHLPRCKELHFVQYVLLT